MTEKELGKALLNLDAATDPRVLTARILERDRRRVRLWTGVTVGTWLLAAALVLLVLVMFGFLMPMQAKLQGDEWKGRVTPVEREQLLHTLELGFKKGMVTTTLS